MTKEEFWAGVGGGGLVRSVFSPCDSMDCSPPWSSPGKNTGCHFLLQEVCLAQGSNPRLLHYKWSPALRVGSLPTEPPGKSWKVVRGRQTWLESKTIGTWQQQSYDTPPVHPNRRKLPANHARALLNRTEQQKATQADSFLFWDQKGVSERGEPGPASHQRALLRSSSKSTASRSPFPQLHEVESRKPLCPWS